MIALALICFHAESVELRQLVYFEAVVRHGGFTRAAEKLRVAQPAISAQVRRLERELDVTLLARTTRRVALTHAGELLLDRARRALAEIEQARDDLAGLSAAVRGRVVVGATPVLGGVDLAGALATFTAAHPQVEVSLRSGLLEPMLDDLGGRYDLVLGPLPTPPRADLEVVALADERFVVITPPGHALASRAALRWADLDGEVVVSLPPATGLRARLTDGAAAAGITVDVRYEAETPQAVRRLVGAGLGLALTVESEARARSGPAIGVHDLHEAPPHPPYGLISSARRGASPAAHALAEHLLRHRTVVPTLDRPPVRTP